MTAAALAWVFGIGFLVALALLTIAVLGNRDLAAENRDLRQARAFLAARLAQATMHPSTASGTPVFDAVWTERHLASVHRLPGLDERTETWGGGA